MKLENPLKHTLQGRCTHIELVSKLVIYGKPRTMRYRCKSFGFSIIELMVALSIFAILAGIAAPSFSGWLKDNRIAGVSLETYGVLNAARSEAISRGVTARVEFAVGSLMTCMVADQSKTCDEPIEDTPVQFVNWDAQEIVIGSNGATDQGIMFDPSGRVTPRQNTIFLTYCDDRGSDNGVVLSLNQIGRAAVNELSDNPDVECL